MNGNPCPQFCFGVWHIASFLSPLCFESGRRVYDANDPKLSSADHGPSQRNIGQGTAGAHSPLPRRVDPAPLEQLSHPFPHLAEAGGEPWSRCL